MSTKYIAVELVKGTKRLVNNVAHSTLSKTEIRVVQPNGKTLLSMWGKTQADIDIASRIADMLNR